jgi:cleavage and polyadenylation specificity factor subunit 5
MSADVAASPEAMDAPDAEAIAAYADGLVHAAGSTHGARTIHVYPVTNYSFGSKAAREEKDATVAEAMVRHKATYQKEGMRRTVCAGARGEPARTPARVASAHEQGSVQAPRGPIEKGRGGDRWLKAQVTQQTVSRGTEAASEGVGRRRVRRAVVPAEPRAVLLPVPPRALHAAERVRRGLRIRAPTKCVFAVPKNTKLLAVPLFELYGNEQRYGALIASVPHLVSRYNLQLEDE